MFKYKIIASKSQKKYTIILSAENESEAKEKLHKDDYSILSIEKISEKDIEGNKFIFQVEKNGEIKNGIIVGVDIFKVYLKLRDELEYNIISLYPEGDDAHTNAEKKQEIISELKKGYELQKKKEKAVKEKKVKEESFYLKKQLDTVYALIEKVLEKFDFVLENTQKYNIDDSTLQKLEHVYEKLIHLKSSTNLVKLKDVGELALKKIGEIELRSVENEKTGESRELLKSTNELLKKIGSDVQYIEKDKDFKRMFFHSFDSITVFFKSLKEISSQKNTVNKKDLIDTQSYSFLKTLLLLEKYKEKLSLNTKDIYKNIFIFINPFSNQDKKERILLKRKVIRQNISILKAKKEGGVGSYTSVKKGYHKIIEGFFSFFGYIEKILFINICLYSFFFLLVIVTLHFKLSLFTFNPHSLFFFILLFVSFLLFSVSKNIFLLSINIVIFSFIFIFSIVNF